MNVATVKTLGSYGLCFVFLCVLLAVFVRPAFIGAAESVAYGDTRISGTGQLQAWDQTTMQWVSPEAFWLSWATTHGGLTWGRRSSYPPYAEVAQRDLIRRAGNAVRRAVLD